MFPSSSPLFLFSRSRCPFHLTFVSCFIPFIFYASSVTHSNGLYEPQLICPFSQMTATRKLCDTRISATMYWPNRCVQMCIIKSSLLLVVGRAIVLYFIANNLPFFSLRFSYHENEVEKEKACISGHIPLVNNIVAWKLLLTHTKNATTTFMYCNCNGCKWHSNNERGKNAREQERNVSITSRILLLLETLYSFQLFR